MRKFTPETPDNCKKTASSLIEEINALPSLSISELDPKKSLLVIVDIVNGFVREGAMASPLVEDIIPPVVSLMEKCGTKKIPSVAFADCHAADCAEFSSFPPHCIKNTSESEIVDEIKKAGGYTLIEKNSTNGFHEDLFIDYLEGKPGIDTFIVTGDCTDICVLQFCLTLKTRYTAQNKNIDIIIPVNCVETYDAPWHDADFMNIAAYKLMKDSGIKFVSEIVD
ncbi:MAG: cysteine hydrolase [Oscillospiraceae bacterium]|nr:cysteine hydrolase [Oscillospiraceae bacterium]